MRGDPPVEQRRRGLIELQQRIRTPGETVGRERDEIPGQDVEGRTLVAPTGERVAVDLQRQQTLPAVRGESVDMCARMQVAPEVAEPTAPGHQIEGHETAGSLHARRGGDRGDARHEEHGRPDSPRSAPRENQPGEQDPEQREVGERVEVAVRPDEAVAEGEPGRGQQAEPEASARHPQVAGRRRGEGEGNEHQRSDRLDAARPRDAHRARVAAGERSLLAEPGEERRDGSELQRDRQAEDGRARADEGGEGDERMASLATAQRETAPRGDGERAGDRPGAQLHQQRERGDGPGRGGRERSDGRAGERRHQERGHRHDRLVFGR